MVVGPEQHPNLYRLLRGDGEISVSSVSISGQGQQQEVTDPDSLQYLSIALRRAEDEGYVPNSHGRRRGLSYYGRLRLSPAGTVLVGLMVPDGADGLILGYPMDGIEDPTYYWVPLPQPMPEGLTEVIRRMKNPKQ